MSKSSPKLKIKSQINLLKKILSFREPFCKKKLDYIYYKNLIFFFK